MERHSWIFAIALVWGLVGCGDDDGTGSVDAGSRRDSGARDSGARSDAGSRMDAGQPDSGQPDAGQALPTCDDAAMNGDETGVDCGGSCTTKCMNGEGCMVTADCVSGFCDASMLCADAPSCTDTTQNGTETDVDCGGDACPACADGGACAAASDCASAVCGSTMMCSVPTCDDSAMNGDETDVDCGGLCATKCADTQMCGAAMDCVSNNCSGGVCVAAQCTDTIRNGDETDVDCGGSCAPCADTEDCLVAGDCVSGVCGGTMSCSAPTCSDTVQNGDETDVDCGGSCAPCEPPGTCTVAGDCTTGVCSGGTCQPASCSDSVQNGDESDVDCGSACPTACANGDDCVVNADCENTFCDSNVCADNPVVAKCGTGNDSVGEFAEACGQVNLHRDGMSFISDPDCSTGCGQTALTYCQEWYPETASTMTFSSGRTDYPFQTAGCGATINRAATTEVACCAPNPCPDGYRAVGEYAEACGQVNLHLESGTWTTDPDCASGCNQPRVPYCQKFYPTAEIAVQRMSTPTDTRDFSTAGCSSVVNRAPQRQVVCCEPVAG